MTNYYYYYFYLFIYLFNELNNFRLHILINYLVEADEISPSPGHANNMDFFYSFLQSIPIGYHSW